MWAKCRFKFKPQGQGQVHNDLGDYCLMMMSLHCFADVGRPAQGPGEGGGGEPAGPPAGGLFGGGIPLEEGRINPLTTA